MASARIPVKAGGSARSSTRKPVAAKDAAKPAARQVPAKKAKTGKLDKPVTKTAMPAKKASQGTNTTARTTARTVAKKSVRSTGVAKAAGKALKTSTAKKPAAGPVSRTAAPKPASRTAAPARKTSASKAPAKKTVAAKTVAAKTPVQRPLAKVPGKSAGSKTGAAPRRITPKQALANTRKLLQAKQAHDRQPPAWQALDSHPEQLPHASGFQSAEAQARAAELHAGESRMEAIQGAVSSLDRIHQGKRDQR